MRAILGYLRRHHLALVAILIATTGTAWASAKLPYNSVGKAQIRKNSVISSKAKNHSLRKKDFKAGRLPAGKRGTAGPKGETGPQGPSGTQGAPGPRGLAGSARAYAWVNGGTSPAIDSARAKGFVSVSNPATGVYCLTFADGLDAGSAAPVVTPVYNSGILESEFAEPSGNFDCPSTQLEIVTYLFKPANSIDLNNSISFTVAIP